MDLLILNNVNNLMQFSKSPDFKIIEPGVTHKEKHQMRKRTEVHPSLELGRFAQ